MLERWAGERSAAQRARLDPAVAEGLEVFLRESRAQLPILRAALATPEAATFEEAARSLAAGCDSVGAERLSSLCVEMQKSLKRDSIESTARILAEVEVELETVWASLQAKLGGPGE